MDELAQEGIENISEDFIEQFPISSEPLCGYKLTNYAYVARLCYQYAPEGLQYFEYNVSLRL